MLKPKLWLACLGATVVLGVQVGGASARNLSISSQTLRATWTSVSFTAPAASVNVRCQMTLEGSFHSRTIAKVAGALVGYITRAGFTACSGTDWRVLTETLPWHTTYQGFSGTLPGITSIRTTLVRPGFQIIASYFGIPVTCTYRTSNVNLQYTREAGGALTTVSLEGRNLIPDEFGCENGGLSGTSTSLTVLNSTTRLTVTLI